MGHPYQELPETAFWKPSVGDRDPLSIVQLARPKQRLSLSEKLGTAGSCFAQHMARHLRQRGFTFVDVEPGPSFLNQEAQRKFGYGVYSARYANIYTTTQLRQLLERAYGLREPADKVWEGRGRHFDPFRTQIEPGGYAGAEEVLADRQSHLRSVRKLFKNIDVFVFTLGLTEAWRSKCDGTIFPIAPGVGGIGAFDPELYEFVNFSFQKVYDDLRWCMKFLRKRRPKLRFILTVSPVPLAATASGEHVLPATIYSKSVLRAVAGQLASELGYVEYFPSYEIISAFPYKGQFYLPGLRDISEEGVTHVMQTFVREFCKDAKDPAPANDDAEELSDAVCEESILAFQAEIKAGAA